jgi:hypothetical protein
MASMIKRPLSVKSIGIGRKRSYPISSYVSTLASKGLRKITEYLIFDNQYSKKNSTVPNIASQTTAVIT